MDNLININTLSKWFQWAKEGVEIDIETRGVTMKNEYLEKVLRSLNIEHDNDRDQLELYDKLSLELKARMEQRVSVINGLKQLSEMSNEHA